MGGGVGGGGGGVANFGRPGGGNNGRGVKAVSGASSEGDGCDDVEWLGEALRAVGGGRSAEGGGGGESGEGGGGGGGLGTYWKPRKTSKRLDQRPNQGRSVGGERGREGGDDLEWVGKALRAEGVWAHIGVRMRAVTGAV